MYIWQRSIKVAKNVLLRRIFNLLVE